MKNRGITLIALIITIIVLLILAGISLAMLSGDNSILQRAVDAKEATDEAETQEKIKLAEMAARINIQAAVDYNLLKEALAKELGAEGTDWTINQESDTPWEVTVNGKKYEINSSSKIEENGVFYVYHSGVADGGIEKISIADCKQEDGTYMYNITQNLTADTLYGGYYSDYAGKGSYAGDGNKVSDGTVYAGDTTSWNLNNSFTTDKSGINGGGIGLAMSPRAGVTYFVKEVPKDYLRSVTYVRYNNNTGANKLKINSLDMITNIDDTNYTSVGFTFKGKNGISGTVDVGTLHSSINIEHDSNGTQETLTSQSMYGVPGYLALKNKNNFLIVPDEFDPEKYIATSAAFTCAPFWITPDGIQVNSAQLFKVYIGNGLQQNWERPGITKQSKTQESTLSVAQ